MKHAILILAFFVNTVPVTAIHSMETSSKILLPEDFTVRGAAGKLIKQDGSDVWFFSFNSAVNDKKEGLDVKGALEVLSSSALEVAAADVNISAAGYRLWGRVTKYKGRNFIFPVDFLPVGEVKDSNSLSSVKSGEKAQPIQERAVEPNDDLGIPKDILDKLSARPSPLVARRRQPEKQMQMRQNSVLVNRTGFFEKCPDGSMVFKLDALGRSIQQTFIRLLPCEVLEYAEQKQSTQSEPIRFTIAGIVTEYKGRKYLLLQRVTRVYNHGNFGR